MADTVGIDSHVGRNRPARTVAAMTTKTPALPFPVTPRRPGEPEADLTGFALIHRALRSGTRDLADAATSIGHGAPCPASRQKAYAAFATEVDRRPVVGSPEAAQHPEFDRHGGRQPSGPDAP